jgi:tRNA A-37 threonylcarbamoyl transferase component Bud32
MNDDETRMRPAGGDETGPEAGPLGGGAVTVAKPAATPGTDGSAPFVPGYEVGDELGRGAMGAVYKGRHLKLNRAVALKVTLGDVDGPALIRFLAEAEAVAAVKHENVVQVYDYGESGGRPYMALEFCPGGSLAARLRAAGPMPPEAAAALVAGVAAGVGAAHAAGIVHRDLKPANVLLADGGRPKVADFGIAKRHGVELTQTLAVMGTPAYMAPEQAQGGAKFVGPPADVWALGVILYECLAGARPFAGTTTDEVLDRVLTAAPERLRGRAPGTPRDLELVCLRCLQKDPADRYPTATDVAADLARFVRGEPVHARRMGAVGQLRRWAVRNRVAASVTALVLALIVAGGVTSGLFAYRARVAAEAAEARAAERDEAVRKQKELVREFMRFLTQDRKLSPVDRNRMAEAFLAAHPELSREEFADVFARRPEPAPDFGELGREITGAGGRPAPNLFGD